MNAISRPRHGPEQSDLVYICGVDSKELIDKTRACFLDPASSKF